jgi:hypothetical protein
MKFYTLDTEFTFGKFNGKTVREVLDLQPSYLDWYLLNLDHFYLSDETIEAIKQIKPNFLLSELANQKRQEKFETWEQAQTNHDDYRQHWTDDDLQMGDWDYDPMNPAHDPSENPWIDVFGPGDEAETAYWNTD